jgi:anti-sigma factor RsiW
MEPVAEAPLRTKIVGGLRAAAVAAALVAAFLLGRYLSHSSRPSPALADELVAAHLRSLEADHLFDLASSDRHAVKPWFDGKVDFAPPVEDFRDRGYTLAGGRLDYLDGHPAAAVVYLHAQHVINVFFWPSPGTAESGPASGASRGYNVAGWTHAGMAGWAVSDLAPEELAALAEMIRKRS